MNEPEMPSHFCHLIFQLWVLCTVFVATTTDEEAEFNPGSYRTLSLWRTLALVIYVGRCLMTVLFMAAIFVIFVLLTHEPSMNYGGEIRYLHSAL